MLNKFNNPLLTVEGCQPLADGVVCMKYKIKNSDLFINNKLHPEGSEVDLTKEQSKGIESFLIPVSNPESTEGSPELVSGSAIISGTLDISESSSEVKINTKNETKSKSKGNKK